MPDKNMTMSADIQVAAREIDFVTRFDRNWRHLMELMGIMRPIIKAPGTLLKKKTASIVLQPGDVPEGEYIPNSKATVVETVYDSITLEKYKKTTTAEAIEDHGYVNAVAETDNAFLVELQDNVTARFYNYLNEASTNKGTQSTWQMALAMAKASVINAFKKMHRNYTEVVGFVNTLDIGKYLGEANITIQNAFGIDYVENFLGYRRLFILSDVEIPQGRVIAVPVENINLYYIDPSGADLQMAGLVYRTAGQTPLLGFAVKANYDNATSSAYALMGMRLFAEYTDGIGVQDVTGTIGTLASLTVASVAGTNTGDTKITITEAKKSPDNVYKYKVGEAAEPVVFNQNVRNWKSWDGKSDITAATGTTITIVEATPYYNAVASGSQTVTAKA